MSANLVTVVGDAKDPAPLFASRYGDLCMLRSADREPINECESPREPQSLL
jgi:hypothetical protein